MNIIKEVQKAPLYKHAKFSVSKTGSVLTGRLD